MNALQRFIVAHLLTVIGEWAITVGILVHAYERDGSTAVGLVSLAVLAPPLVCAPLAAWLSTRFRPHRVRLGGFAVQLVAYAAAATTARAGAATVVVAGCVVVGLGAINTLRPTGAVLLPAVVSSTADLVTGNLRTSYCDSSSALLGPLAAAGLAAIGGSTAVFGACAAASGLALAASAWRPAPLAAHLGGGPIDGVEDIRRGTMRLALGELRRRPWSIGVLGVASARNLVVGAFDVLLVIVALQSLDLGQQGPGLLTALVGTGALLSTVVATVVVRRATLRPALIVALAVTASICVVLGLRSETAALVMVVLPLSGICLSLMDNLSRMLLQRSTDPRILGPLFAVLGLVAGLAQVLGSAIAQGLYALGGMRAAMIGIAALLVALVLVCRRALISADSHAEVPVVEMTLLMGLPMFAPLPAATLEAVARSTERTTFVRDDVVIRQGELGDAFYAVAEGAFDVEVDGQLIRTARRGDCFGDIALLADVPRTATVTARESGALLGVHRDPFLVAVTGHERAYGAALARAHEVLRAAGSPQRDRAPET